MARLIKAYDKPDSIVFEVSVLARNERRAKIKAGASLLGRRPANVTAVTDIVATPLGDGLIKEYRVEIEIDDDSDLRSILKLDEALKQLEELL